VTDDDLQGLMGFYTAGRKSGDFDTGVRRALTAVLAHPDFLFRSDEPGEDLPPGSIYRLDDLSLASRLSFFLWSSLPDDALLEVAAAGKLHEPEELKRQVRRMLADPRSSTLAGNFGSQWLNLTKLPEITPDPAIFPYASGAVDLREDFKTEIALFMDSVFRNNESVLELLNSKYTYVNERLALHYDINNVRGDQFRRVELQDSTRWGLLGKGGVLMTSVPQPHFAGAAAPACWNGSWARRRSPAVEALPETAGRRRRPCATLGGTARSRSASRVMPPSTDRLRAEGFVPPASARHRPLARTEIDGRAARRHHRAQSQCASAARGRCHSCGNV
jgi:hypothetical protein